MDDTERPIRYLSTADIGGWFGYKGNTITKWRSRYHSTGTPFPPEDALTGTVPGWLPEREEEIREWERNRPGPGRRTDLVDQAKEFKIRGLIVRVVD